MAEPVVKTVKFVKVLSMLVAGGVALLVSAIIQDRSHVVSAGSLLGEKAYADVTFFGDSSGDAGDGDDGYGLTSGSSGDDDHC